MLWGRAPPPGAREYTISCTSAPRPAPADPSTRLLGSGEPGGEGGFRALLRGVRQPGQRPDGPLSGFGAPSGACCGDVRSGPGRALSIARFVGGELTIFVTGHNKF